MISLSGGIEQVKSDSIPHNRVFLTETQPWPALEIMRQTKRMDFFAWLGARRRHSRNYGNDEQRRHAEKDVVLCFIISKVGH
jgi:hypothetical protein